MAKRLLGAVLGAVLTLSLSVAPAQAAAVDFTGVVALDNCSGSVVRTPGADPADPALVLTNAHCVKFMAAGEVTVDKGSSRTFTLLNRAGNGSLGTLRATRLLYATMTGTDVALYRLSSTYRQVERMGSRALELSTEHPVAGADISVVSGYWKKVYSCRIDGFVHEVRESDWVWKDSIRYTPECDTIGGTSGSPVVDPATGKVVGVNNTGNEDGKRCTFGNPCEVDPDGNVTVRRGTRYGQQTFQAVPCLPGGGEIDLAAPGCGLPRP
jgi:V8-like Glu-specific endopeptidase